MTALFLDAIYSALLVRAGRTDEVHTPTVVDPAREVSRAVELIVIMLFKHKGVVDIINLLADGVIDVYEATDYVLGNSWPGDQLNAVKHYAGVDDVDWSDDIAASVASQRVLPVVHALPNRYDGWIDDVVRVVLTIRRTLRGTPVLGKFAKIVAMQLANNAKVIKKGVKSTKALQQYHEYK